MRKIIALISLTAVVLIPLASSAAPTPSANDAAALPCFLGICI